MTVADESSDTVYFDGAVSEGLAGERTWLRHADGTRNLLPVDRWLGTSLVGSDSEFDRRVADKCLGPTVDLGCGPGRLVHRLTGNGIAALGVDHSDQAVSMTRAQGGVAIRRSLFDRLPGEGRWRHVLLLDGNIGIGGDPDRVARRASELVAAGGSIIVELDSGLAGLWRGAARVETESSYGDWFPWARVGIDYARELAETVGLHYRCETIGGRGLMELTGR
ncbi:SAM-dependent methyltransferase [Williamsia soli]|uniref:SAM-dependent methyltransferase n=1 Tax=Williamsia soli TaxID=364929 RepID=UPI001A9F42EA|nr:SAM-dependent methyltransferase [Williamsia soli]